MRALRTPALLALVALYTIWSSTYLALRWVVEGAPPLLAGGVRYLLAGVILFVILRLRGAVGPTRAEWLRSIPIGALLFLVGNGFVAIAEQQVPSGLAAVACAAMPLFVASFGVVGGERPSRLEWIGLVLGFIGVASMAAGDLHASKGAAILLVLAPIGWALGSTGARKLALPKGPMSAAAQMIAGGLSMLLVAVVRGESISHAPSTRVVLSLAYLVVFGSIVAFSAYNYLLRTTPPSIATSYAYVNPILAVVLGALVGAERFSVSTLVAGALVVAGVAVIVTAKRRAAPPPQFESSNEEARKIASQPAR